MQSLKKVKLAGVDNIPAELIQAGGEAVIIVLSTICKKIWQIGEEITSSVDPVFGLHTSQERQPAAVPELQNDHPHQPPN